MTPARMTRRPTFRSDEQGSVAMIFGIAFFVFFFAAGMAIDYGRVVHYKSRIAAAVDSAALAAGKGLLDGRLSDADVIAMAQEYFNSNVDAGGDNFGDVTSLDIQVDRDSGSVSIDVIGEVPMTFTRIAGYTKINVPVSTAAKFEQKDIELGMQLDLTGSMSGSKIADLREATRDLVDILLPDGGTPNKVRIGYAPFASGINLGPYAGLVTNGRNGPSNCVYDRVGAAADSDDIPAAGAYWKGRLDVPTAQNCPGIPLLPLTDDKDTLKSVASSFVTSTTTAGQIGTNWAWNLISPKWATIWPMESVPAAYKDGKTVKAVVLMTDGEYNTFDGRCDSGGCTPYGTRGRQSNEHAKELCENMKREDVIVFTVGFMLNHPAATETLGECATSPQHYFNAENGEQLRTAFAAIATQLNNLRLTK